MLCVINIWTSHFHDNAMIGAFFLNSLSKIIMMMRQNSSKCAKLVVSWQMLEPILWGGGLHIVTLKERIATTTATKSELVFVYLYCISNTQK